MKTILACYGMSVISRLYLSSWRVVIPRTIRIASTAATSDGFIQLSLNPQQLGARMRQMIKDKIAALRCTALFGELSEKDLHALAEHAIERRLKRDEILFVAGDEAAGLFVIVDGSLRAYREGVDGREQVIHVEHAGATIAELPVFDDKPYPSTVAAEEDTVLLFLDKRNVKSLCLAHPEIGLAALKLMAGRLRKCAELVTRILRIVTDNNGFDPS